MSALSRCLAEIEALGEFDRQHGDELLALGKQARVRELAGESHEAVMAWYANETAAIYRAAGREAPSWTAPFLIAEAA